MDSKKEIKEKKPIKKMSWFQVLIAFFFGFSSVMGRNAQAGYGYGEILQSDFVGIIAETFGAMMAILLFMWIYNRFVHPRIKVKSILLKKIWFIIRIVIIVFIVAFLFLFVFGVANS